jgi:hypothetical protein
MNMCWFTKKSILEDATSTKFLTSLQPPALAVVLDLHPRFTVFGHCFSSSEAAAQAIPLGKSRPTSSTSPRPMDCTYAQLWRLPVYSSQGLEDSMQNYPIL